MKAPRRPQNRPGTCWKWLMAGPVTWESKRKEELDLLADEHADRGEHRDAAVGDLHVGVALRLGLVDVVEESEGVESILKGAHPFTRPASTAADISENVLPAVTTAFFLSVVAVDLAVGRVELAQTRRVRIARVIWLRFGGEGGGRGEGNGRSS